MQLCSNRFEGYGPKSTIHPSLPTACFIDTVLVPLPTWFFMASIPVLFLILRNSSSTSHNTKSSYDKLPQRRSILQRILSILYWLLIVAMVAMISLELARLSVAQLGVGLLPFSYIGVLLAAATHWSSRSAQGDYAGRSRRSWILRAWTAVFWVFLLGVMSAKAAAAKDEENAGFLRTGTQAKYPVDDSYVDNLTMAVVEGVLAILELVIY